MAVDQAPERTCINCGTLYRGSFCPCCGQSHDTKRLTLRQIAVDVLSIFTNFDSGFMHTCLDLLYRPGYMMRDYLQGRRKGYVKPMQLIFLLGTIILLMHYAFYGEGYTMQADPVDPTEEMAELEQDMQKVAMMLLSNNTLIYLMMVVLMVIPNWVSFHLSKAGRTLNLAEHFYIMVYTGCQMIMIDMLQMPFERMMGYNSTGVTFGLPVIFMVINYSQLLGISARQSILHTVASLVISVIPAVITLGILGIIYQ